MNEIDVTRFDLRETIECGQTFCWVPEGKGYINADIGQVVYVEQKGQILRWKSSNDDVNIVDMFRLDDPLDKIQKEIKKDAFMKECITFSPNLRIVRDPVYPCLVSFLCATWKNIPAIQTMVRRIRERCGPRYELNGKTYCGMPTPEMMCDIDSSFLRSLGLAWRADFIRKTTDMITDGIVDLEGLRRIPYEDAHRRLKLLHGVGDKVADCVSLFALGHLEAFPIDIWIERIIEERYGLFTSAGKSYRRKSQAARAYFGRYAGYAQEYMYNYARNRK